MKRLLVFLFVCAACACLAAKPPKGLFTAPLLAIEEIHAGNLTLETAEDGSRYIAMRLHLEGASAVRVHLSNVQVGAGQQLVVSSADGSRVVGPYVGSGPTNSGDFWTEPVQGSDVVIELQTGADGVADLPFTIDAIEAAEGTDALAESSEPAVEMQESWYKGSPITHAVVDGIAVYEGDILLGPASELPRAQPGSSKDRTRSAVAITGQNYRWANATIPYVIPSTLPNPARVTTAVAHWNAVMAGVVRMVPRTTETSYITFNRSTSAGTCNSYIGKVFYTGAQPVQLGDSCSTGNVIHEIGHAWGLWHEHTREDRDRFVTINTLNIQSGQSYNFTKNVSTGDDIGSYDYNSIMHYNSTAFSVNGLPTIVTIPAGIAIGQRSALSTGDIAAIKALYPPPVTAEPALVTSPIVVAPPAPVVVSTTITANPVGAPIVVDGTTYASPQTFSWNAGSAHTIGAPGSTVNGTRYTFASWSDAGAQSHTITAATAVTTFKVDYALSYLVQAQPVAPTGGTVTSTPATLDSFFTNGTTVGLNAAPSSGYCFAGWSGLVAGAPSSTSVTANKPYSVTANFQTGSVSLPFSSFGLPKKGGTLTLNVTASSGCLWNVVSSASWITITSGSTGNGAGTFTFTVPQNNTGVIRTGTITVGSSVMTLRQSN